jgi:hypothetical protein
MKGWYRAGKGELKDGMELDKKEEGRRRSEYSWYRIQRQEEKC